MASAPSHSSIDGGVGSSFSNGQNSTDAQSASGAKAKKRNRKKKGKKANISQPIESHVKSNAQTSADYGNEPNDLEVDSGEYMDTENCASNFPNNDRLSPKCGSDGEDVIDGCQAHNNNFDKTNEIECATASASCLRTSKNDKSSQSTVNNINKNSQHSNVNGNGNGNKSRSPQINQNNVQSNSTENGSVMATSNDPGQPAIDSGHNMQAFVRTSPGISQPSDSSDANQPDNANEGNEDDIDGIDEPFTSSNTKLNSTGVSFAQPKYIHMAIPAKRKATFSKWKEYFMDTRLKIDELVDCGMFYSGQQDTVCCFYCGQALGGWEPGERPWAEHARWSPNCTHVYNMKGLEFVREILKVSKDKIKMREIDEKYKNTPKNVDTSNYIADMLRSISITELTEEHILEYPAVQSVLLLEPSKEKVLKCVNILAKRKKINSLNFTAEELMEVIFDVDDGIIKDSEMQSASMGLIDLETDGETTKKRHNANKIVTENKMLKKSLLCKHCNENMIGIIFLPCGHMCCCAPCAPKVLNCLVCKNFIHATFKTFLS